MYMTQLRGPARRAIAAAATAGVLALALTSCASRGGDGSDSGDGGEGAAGTEIGTFAIVAPENESDFGWNQAGLEGAQVAADETGAELIALADAGWDNVGVLISQVISEGAEFVIAHASGYGVDASAVAAEEGVPVLIQDAGENVPGEVAITTTSAEQGGYLAGIAAAMSTTSNVIGIVVSADDLNWFKMSSGFAEGAYSVNPDIEVLYASVGPAAYADAAGGKTAVEGLIAAGADVIFGMGDGATHGYIQAVEAADGVKYIADIGDVTPGLTDQSVLLTSVLWNYETVYLDAIEDIEAGTFGEGGYNLDVENGGLSLQETENLTDEIKAAVEDAKAAIISGEIVPTSAENADEVLAVIG